MPARSYRELDLSFEGGLNNEFESSLKPEGAVDTLENWVPEKTKGVRIRPGWKAGTRTGGPATAKGLGLGVFSATRRPKYLQKASGSGTTVDDGTTTRILTLSWPTPTQAGNTLICKLGVSTTDVVSFSWALSDTGSWQLLTGLLGTNNGDGDGFIFFKENAASESSLTLKFRMANTNTDFNYVYELTEIPNVQTSAPKNLLSGAAAIGPIHLSSGINPGLTVAGWESDLNIVYAYSGGQGPPPWTANTQSGTPTYGLPGWNFVVPANQLGKFGTLGGASGAPVAENTQYTASVWMASGGSLTHRVNLLWYNSGGGLISTTNGTTFVGSGAFQRKTLTATSPAGAVYAKFQIENTTTTGTNQTISVSGAQLELGASVTNWAHGSLSCIDQINFALDITSPVDISAPASTVSLSLSEAAFLSITGSVATASWATYTETADVSKTTQSFQINLTSAWKRLTSAGSTQSDSITMTNFPGVASECVWALFNIKIAGSAVATDHFYIAGQDDTTSFGLWYINQDNIDSGSWTLIENVSATTNGAPVAYAPGLGVMVFTQAGMATARAWPGVGAATVSTPVEAGSAVAFFKSRFFVSGSGTNPTRLNYSDVSSYTSWPVANFIEIDQDDGYAILDLASQQTYLVIAKGNRLYTLAGSGPDTFYLLTLPYGEAAPGRSIAVTPGGAIVAGKTAVWSVVSSTVEDVSKQLSSEYHPTGYVHSTYADGKVYILDVAAKVTWVYDLESSSWYKEDFVSDNNQGTALISVLGQRLLQSPLQSTDTGLVYYRDHPAASRVRDFSPLSSTATLKTATVWPVGPGEMMTPRWLFLQIRQRGSNSGAGQRLNITASYDGSSGVPHYFDPKGDGVWRHRLDLGTLRSCSSIQFTFTGPDSGNQYDIESAILGYDVEAIR